MQKLCCVRTRQQFSASLDYFVTSLPPYLHQFSSISGGNCIKLDHKVHPMYKVDPLLVHTQVISMRVWRLGRDISGDEQMLGFQGRHADKLHITYKAEGDSFQCDAICDTGYTWMFYFRNQPAPWKWLHVGWWQYHIMTGNQCIFCQPSARQLSGCSVRNCVLCGNRASREHEVSETQHQ